MGKVIELKHPLVSHHMATLRDKATPPHLFREQVGRLSLLLTYEATAELPLEPIRDEATFQPEEYYKKFSGPPPEVALVVDPILATGGSACEGIRLVKKWGVEQISFLSIIAAPEGIETIATAHPDVDIFTCAIDDHLNEQAYIVPGLGDAGDRIFNTL